MLLFSSRIFYSKHVSQSQKRRTKNITVKLVPMKIHKKNKNHKSEVIVIDIPLFIRRNGSYRTCKKIS